LGRRAKIIFFQDKAIRHDMVDHLTKPVSCSKIPSPPSVNDGSIDQSRQQSRQPPPPPPVPPLQQPSTTINNNNNHQHPPPPPVNLIPVVPIPQAPPIAPPQPPPLPRNGPLLAYNNNSRTSKNNNNITTRQNNYNYSNSNEVNCDTCSKSFYNVGAYKRHVDECHIYCAEEGCTYHGPPDKVDVHMAFKHAKDANGTTIVDTPEDIELWRKARKRNFPTNNNVLRKESNVKKKQKIGALADVNVMDYRNLSPTEILIRKRQSTAHGMIGQKAPNSSLVPYLRKAHHRLNDALTEAFDVQVDSKSPKVRRKQEELIKLLNCDGVKTGGWMISNTSLLHTPFPICGFIDKGRVCPHGKDCHLSHDTAAYSRYKYQRKCAQTDFPRRPPLSYLLLSDEIMKSESLLLQAFRFIVRSNFLQEEGLEAALELRLKQNNEEKALLNIKNHTATTNAITLTETAGRVIPPPPPPPQQQLDSEATLRATMTTNIIDDNRVIDICLDGEEEESLESGEVDEEEQ